MKAHNHYDNLSWDEVSELLSDYNLDVSKMIIATTQASNALLEYDEMEGQNTDLARIDDVASFILKFTPKSAITKEIINHCSSESIKKNKENIESYLVENYNWIRPSFAIDTYDRFYYDSLANNACYDKEAKKIKLEESEKYSDESYDFGWRERPSDVFVDYQDGANNRRYLKLYVGEKADVDKLTKYIEQNNPFLQKANNYNYKLREQIVVKTAINWLCLMTNYNDKTIARILISAFKNDKSIKLFLPTHEKIDDDSFAAKIRGIRNELKNEMESDWFSEARKELELDRKANSELYESHYNSNPIGPFFERFNLSFDSKNKKFHLSVI